MVTSPRKEHVPPFSVMCDRPRNGATVRGIGLSALLIVCSPIAAQGPIESRPTVTLPSNGAGAAVPFPRPAAEDAPRSSSDLTFGLVLQTIFSDNFNLESEGLATSGRGVEVIPYLDGYVRTSKSRGDAALRLRKLWYTTGGTSDSTLSPDVRASGDLSVKDDAVRFAGSAYVFSLNPSPFLATSIDPASRTAEADLYKAYAVSPYSLGRFGSSDYELRYRAQSIDPGGAALKSTGQQVAGGLASTRESGARLGWSTHADVGRVEYEDSSEFTRSSAEVLGYYGVTPLLRLGAGVNYSRVDVLVNSEGDNSGFGPTAFLSWRPGPRTSITGKYADTYYGSESSLRVAHRSVRWLFGASYIKGLQAGSESGLLYFDPNVIFSLPEVSSDDGGLVRGLAERRLFSGAGQSLLFGQTGNPLVFDESLIASAALLGARNSFMVAVFTNDQQEAPSSLAATGTRDLTQRGATFTADHRLGPSSSTFASLYHLFSESNQTQQESRLTALTLGWQLNLSRQSTFTLTVRASKQTSAGEVPSDEYRERAVIAAIGHKF